MSYNVNKMYIIEIQPGVKAKFNTSILIPIYQLVNFWINRIKKDLLVFKKSQIIIKHYFYDEPERGKPCIIIKFNIHHSVKIIFCKFIIIYYIKIMLLL